MRPSLITYPADGINPIGIIEIVHGMCEHKERYIPAMKEFNKRGFICAIADIKGHGENVLTTDNLGFFGEKGYRTLVDDVQEYTMFLRREYPKLPVILLGHSMGSLIVRTYLKRHSKEVDAVVISGSPSKNPMAFLAKKMIRIMALFHGWHYKSPMVADMVNKPFEKPFENEGILNAWLSSDRHVAEVYNEDPLCGFQFTLNGYYTLMNLMEQTYGKTGWISKNRSLPVMFISGANDPCRGNDKKFKQAVTFLKHSGYPNTYFKLYQDMRHELFNEPNNEEVYNDIVKFLEIKAKIEAIDDEEI